MSDAVLQVQTSTASAPSRSFGIDSVCFALKAALAWSLV